MMNPEELPPSAQRAFDEYPRIEPSPAFNRAVLQSLEAAGAARRQTFVGRVEEWLGLKWWQFAASGLLGALLPALILGVLLLSNRGAAPTQHAPINPLLPRSIGPLYAREEWHDEFSAPLTDAPQPPNQPRQGDEVSCVVSKFRSV